MSDDLPAQGEMRSRMRICAVVSFWVHRQQRIKPLREVCAASEFCHFSPGDGSICHVPPAPNFLI
jgi:hypothetical protein